MRPEVSRAALAAASWPTEAEGRRLFELARESASRGPCMEVGGFHLRSALFVAEGCREAEGYPLFCVDRHHETTVVSVDPLLRSARGVGLEHWMVALVADPRVAGRFWPDDNVSLLLVHGDHETVADDVRLWAHATRRGGYLCVHRPAAGDAGAARLALDRVLPSERWEYVERVGELDILRRRRSLVGPRSRRSATIVRDSVAGGRVTLESSRHLGTAPAIGGHGWSIVGQDGGQSIDLGDRTLFVFSDTLLSISGNGGGAGEAPFGNRFAFLANTAAVGSGSDLRGALAGARYFTDPAGRPRELIAATPEEAAGGIRFWPEHGILLDGRVYIFYLGIFATDVRSTWSFENRGVGLAVLDPETGCCERVTRAGDWCLWPNTADDLHLGVQVLREGDHVYLFGSTRSGTRNEAIVGRVPVGRVADPDAYAFLGGAADSEWASDPAAARGLGPCAPDYSVSHNPYLGLYTMLYVDGESKTLRLRTASSLTGPFGPPATIGSVAHHPTSELVYLAFEHPKFREQEGRVVHLSYSQPRFARNSLVRLRFP